jgi:acetolactate synthase regulatory subunit
MLLSILLNEKDIEEINRIHGLTAHVQIIVDTDRSATALHNAEYVVSQMGESFRIKPYP